MSNKVNNISVVMYEKCSEYTGYEAYDTWIDREGLSISISENNEVEVGHYTEADKYSIDHEDEYIKIGKTAYKTFDEAIREALKEIMPSCVIITNSDVKATCSIDYNYKHEIAKWTINICEIEDNFENDNAISITRDDINNTEAIIQKAIEMIERFRKIIDDFKHM